MSISDNYVLREHINIVDAHYERLIGQEGLYNVAFFGSTMPKGVKRKLNALRKKAIRLAKQEVRNVH